ncbi:citryl-CoA lyase [Patescibacteria group bacterium]
MSTVVTHKNNKPYFGNTSLLKLVSKKNFAYMIYLLLSEKKPNKSQLKLFETILNISIDHGSQTPSAIEIIKDAKKAKSISVSLSQAILQINDDHGGAIKPAMELFYKIKKDNLNIKKMVNECLKQDRKIPGLGHRIYTIDPRAEFIFNLAQKENMDDFYINIAKQIEKEISLAKGKPIPVNIDGVIASILCTFDWPARLGNAVFIIARTPGLIGHYLNNQAASKASE